MLGHVVSSGSFVGCIRRQYSTHFQPLESNQSECLVIIAEEDIIFASRMIINVRIELTDTEVRKRGES